MSEKSLRDVLVRPQSACREAQLGLVHELQRLLAGHGKLYARTSTWPKQHIHVG